MCGPEPLDVEKQETPEEPSLAMETHTVMLGSLPSYRATASNGVS